MVYRIAFQPIWDLVNQEVVAYEALMRPRDGHLAFLRRIGARYAQGFYLGMPKFAEEYEEGSLSKHVAHWY